MYFIGVDAGTTEIKCVIFDESGTGLGRSRRITELICNEPGQVEQDPNQIWNYVRETIRETLAASKISPQNIASIGVAGQSGGTLLLDPVGKPLKMMCWRDIRSVSTLLRWKSEGKENEFYELTGWPLWPEFASVQLAWLKEREPKLLSRAKTLVSCADWVAHRLTHNVRASASSLIGLIDSRNGRYSDRLFTLCGIEGLRGFFPQIIDAWEVYGRVHPIAAQETGLLEGTPVVSAGYDIACGAAGAGGVRNGRAVCVLGTSGTNLVVSDRPVRDPEHSAACAYHVVPALWLAISESMTAVPNLNWFIDQFGAEEKHAAAVGSKSVFALCDQLIQDITPGSAGLLYHSYLSGETGPFVDPNARAAFFGISQSHTRKHFLRAVYEGVGYSIRHNFTKLQTLNGLKRDFDSIALVGGGSRSNAWCQIIADIMQKKVVTCKEVESGCVGAAMAGGIAVNAFSSFDEAVSKFVRLNEEYSPNHGNATAYNEGFGMYLELIERYKPVWSRNREGSEPR